MVTESDSSPSACRRVISRAMALAMDWVRLSLKLR